MRASGEQKVLPCSLLLLYKLRLCLCAEAMSAESCGKQSFFFFCLFMNRGTEGSCGCSSHILKTQISCERMRKKRAWKRGNERERERSQSRRWAVSFLSTLRNKWSRASRLERENKERESCSETLSILTVLLAHLGHLFFSLSPPLPVTDDTAGARRIWETVSRNTFTSGQTCPGPRPSPPHHLLSIPPPIQSVHCPASRTFLTWLLISLLTLQRHISPSPANCPSLLLFFSFFHFFILLPCDAVWLRTLCRGTGEICDSIVSQWRRGNLRTVLYWMCEALKKMCSRKITHPRC